MKNLLILCLSFFTNAVFSQSIKGKILDAKSGESLPGATVVIEGTTIGSNSDMEGNYQIISLKEGTYNLVFTYIGYVPDTLKNIVVKNGENKIVNRSLGQNIKQLKAATVTSRKITHTETAVLMETRKAEQIVNGVSSQQIAKTQDKSAADVIKRIPGITIIEDKFIMVRGLSERYNSVLLNGAMAPGAEADKRSFSFDIIPSRLLDRVLIYKTAAPELPGDMSGASVKIFTRNTPDENMTQAFYSTACNSNTTFKKFYATEASKTDLLGYDNGFRQLPGKFPQKVNNSDVNQQVALGRELPNSWIINTQNTSPDQQFGFMMGRNFSIGKLKGSQITSLTYSYETRTIQRKIYNYNLYDRVASLSDTIYKYTDDQSQVKVNIGAISNWQLITGKRSKIEFKNLFNQTGTNTALIRNGENFESGNEVRSYASRYKQRTVYSGQLHGDHDFRNDLTNLSWTGGFNYALSKEPDYRRLRTVRNLGSDDSIPLQLVVPPSASLEDLGRFYSAMNETAESVAINMVHKLKKQEDDSKTIKWRAGFYFENKDRDYHARWMSYKKANLDNFDNSLLFLPVEEVFNENNINNTTGFKIEEGTNPTDKYIASDLLTAGYAGISLPINRLLISGGLRVENNNQQLSIRDYGNNPVKVDNKETSFLPSANVSYGITQKLLVRAAYGRTLNRTEFREVAPFAYYDFVYNESLNGNPSLKTAFINNYDMRLEWYPENGELITLGVFYKDFTNAMEKYSLPGGGGGGRNFVFGNAPEASSLGAEVEIKKSLSFIHSGFFHKMAVAFNASLIKSSVDLGDNAKSQAHQRPLMGQSPYIVNGGLFYEDFDKKFQWNILYNVVGERLYAAGSDGNPDIYEMPRHQLDISVSKGFGKHLELKAGVRDLLNNAYVLKQDGNQDGNLDHKDEIISTYKPGYSYTLGISYKL